MKTLLTVLFLILFTPSVWAIDVPIQWDDPTTRTDGTCIGSDPVNRYHIFFSQTRFGFTDGEVLTVNKNNSPVACIDTGVDAGTGCGNVFTCTYVILNAPSGDCWYLTMTVETVNERESLTSNSAHKCLELETSASPLKNVK